MDAEFFCLDLGRLQDELYNFQTDAKEWIQSARTAGRDGFPAGSLRSIAPIPFKALLERLVVIPVYTFMNAAPLLLPPLLYFSCGLKGALSFMVFLGVAHLLVVTINPLKCVETGQYAFPERNEQKYNSIKYLWPKSLHPPSCPGPKIFCAIPHGLMPIGLTAYPFMSKIFGMCHWTGAPILLKLPLVSYWFKLVGGISADSKEIKGALMKNESVGVALDGVAGMFQTDSRVERGWVKKRKGIVKIALTTGVPLVPMYGFGHSSLWRIVVDPFRILERISVALNISVVPFCGRPWGVLPFGPPYRLPVLVALGEPIIVPKVAAPTQDQIDEYHAKLMSGFMQTFEQHKAAYGWQDKKLELV